MYGAFDYLVKPFRMEAIAKILNKINEKIEEVDEKLYQTIAMSGILLVLRWKRKTESGKAEGLTEFEQERLLQGVWKSGRRNLKSCGGSRGNDHFFLLYQAVGRGISLEYLSGKYTVSSMVMRLLRDLEGMILQPEYDELINKAYTLYGACDSLEELFEISRELLQNEAA